MVKKVSLKERESSLRKKLKNITLSEESDKITIRVNGDYKRELGTGLNRESEFIPGEVYKDRNGRLYLCLGFARTPISVSEQSAWFLTELSGNNNELIFIDKLSENMLSRNIKNISVGN